MDNDFKDWLLEDSLKWEPDIRRDILLQIRDERDRFVSVVMDSLEKFAMLYIVQTSKTVMIQDVRAAAVELVEAYRELYAEEIKSLP